MDSSASFLRRPSPSSDHFLVLFSSPPSSTPPSGGIVGDEFNESEVFWTGDFAQSNEHRGQSRISNHFQRLDRRSCVLRTGNSGILSALTDDVDDDLQDKQRDGFGPFLTRKNSISSASSSRSIPRPQQSPNDREHSQSAPARKFQQSAPINVPIMAKARTKQRNGEYIASDEEDDKEMLPPHEIVVRGSGVSPKTTFSVLEGVGRTLKGRDLRQVRNAVWRRTGFLD